MIGEEATPEQVQTLMQFMGSFEPVRYSCGCGRSVARPKALCIRCGNAGKDSGPSSQVEETGR